MRLLIDGRFLAQPLTGVQRYARSLCTALDESLQRDDPRCRGLEVTVLVPRLDVPPPAFTRLHVQRVGPLRGHAWEQLLLPRAARHHDVLFCPGNIAPLLSLRGRTPVVVTVHDLAFRYHPDTVSPLFRRAYEVLVPSVMRHATRIVTVSEAERTRMLEHFPQAEDRLVAVPNGGPTGSAAPIVGARAASPPVLLYVGALNERKNVSGVLAATKLLLGRHPDLTAVFIGSTASAFAAVDLGQDHDRIRFLGAVDDATLAQHYRDASVLLFPSFHEASGLPPLEAMAHGCPVVVSDIPALRERCGDAAVYCDPHDVNSIATAAERVLLEEPLRHEMVRRGRERVALFTWERCLVETLAVLRQAAAEGHSPRRNPQPTDPGGTHR